VYLSRSELAGFDYLPDAQKCRAILETVRLFIFLDMMEMRCLTLPTLYDSGIVYDFQGETDRWLDAVRMVQEGKGSCNSLAAYRIAELRLAGEDARPYIRTQTTRKPDGNLLDVFHVIVHRPTVPFPHDWEDPSLTLGMPDVG
jgi:hypothetical protein